MSPAPNEEKISDDAKCVYSAFFTLGRAGSSKLIFQMEKSRPTERTQKALDELVSQTILIKKPFNRFGGVVYTLNRVLEKRERASMALMKRNSFNLTEPA